MTILKTAFIFCLISASLSTVVSEQGHPHRDPRKLQVRADEYAYNATIPIPVTCNKSLLQSLNMFGRDTSTMTSLVFCPKVRNSCCTVNDQIAIYDNWITEKELANLDVKFANYTDVISKFFEVASQVTVAAGQVLEYMNQMNNNECKMMARRIVTYQIDDLREVLGDLFANTFNFYKQAYKGLYCGVCEAENQQFLDANSKKIKVSESFCRSIIANSLNTMTYYKVHLPKYINLLSTFMATCSAKGRFIQDTVPDEVFVDVDQTTEANLAGCFRTRNLPIWLNNCQKICQKWNPGKLTNLFLPSFNQLIPTIQYLSDRLSNLTVVDSPNSRILKEQNEHKIKHIKIRRLTNYQNHVNLTNALANSTMNPSSINYTNPLIFQALNGTFPNETDERGYPLNITNFTDLGSNLTAVAYVDFIEGLFGLKQRIADIDPEDMTVYRSQNTTTSTGLDEYTIEVNTDGIDFYKSSQYSLIDKTLIQDLIEGTSTKTERRLKMIEAHEKLEKEMESGSKHKQRELKSGGIVQALVVMLCLLLWK